jgi:type I restriction enzyme, S subunit
MTITSDESSILSQIKTDAVGQIPPHWKIRSVGELIRDGVLDKIQDGNHGESHPVALDYLPVGIPFLMSGNIRNGRVNMSESKFLAPEHARSLRVGHARRGDVLLTHKGNDLGRTAILREADWAVLTPQITYYRIKNLDALLPDFLKCVFESVTFQHQFKRDSEQSTRPFVSISNQQNLYLPIPPIGEQRAIAHILGTLDAKIELNRQMNETLEAIARAIFKSWFVDFDPVRAKAEGRDPGLPKHIADVFPDRFEESDLGEIPAGWEVWRVADVGNVICGKTPSTMVAEYYGDDIPFITIPDMHGKIFATNVERKLSLTGADSQKNKMLPGGAICVSCIATPGLVVITSERSQTNQQINSIVPGSARETYFWYWVFRGLGDDIRAGGSGGSVLSNLSTGRFSELPVLAPLADLRVRYNAVVTPLFGRLLANENENATLAALRDTLLPKLVSGEIRVKDAEYEAEGVGA